MAVPSHLELVENFVRPWYLKMHGAGGATNGHALAADIGVAARNLDADVLVRLLRYGWREQSMGAWLTIAAPLDPAPAEVLRALERSRGHLDATPLAAAAVYLHEGASADSLEVYYTRAVANGFGGTRYIEEAGEYLRLRFGAHTGLPMPAEPTDTFERLIEVAGAIRHAA